MVEKYFRYKKIFLDKKIKKINMKNFISIILSILFFFWSFQDIFANQCSEENILKYFINFENFSNKESEEKFLKEFEKNISDQKDFYINKNIWEKNQLKRVKKINSEFIKKQDEKFSLAIKYAIKKFSEENWNSNLKWIKTETYLKKLEKNDIFIKKYLDENKKNKDFRKNLKSIPVSVLQKSVYLDFLIFSCELWALWIWKDFFSWWNISDILSKSDSEKFEKEEILEKQQIVVEKSISKYKSFLNNREIYIALRWVIEKLEHLKWRFEDFARLIWFLPAKLVDFWYHTK